MTQKIAIIGFDGATFDVITPLAKRGLMPNFKRFMEEGAHGPLVSTLPPLSPVAWTSMITGVNPAKHGVFDFIVTKRHENERRIHFNSGGDRKIAPIWSHIGEYKMKSVALNVPMTYPPDKIPGVIVSGMDAPSVDSDFVHPPEAKEKLLQAAPEYVIEMHMDRRYLKRQDLYLKDLFASEEAKLKASLHFANTEDWSFYMTVFTGLDRTQHMFMDVFDFTAPAQELAKNPVLATYMKMDEYLGRLMEQLGDGINVLVVSDHGFGPVRNLFSLNKWLIQNGYMKLAKEQDRQKKFLQDNMGKIRRKIQRMLSPGGPVESSMFGELEGRSVLRNVDWENTQAFSFGSAPSIYINREAVPDPAERVRLIERMTTGLRQIKDPMTGEYIFRQVEPADTAYEGPLLEQGPDIVAEHAAGWQYEQMMLFGSERVSGQGDPISRQPGSSGNHVREGILLAKGPLVKQGALLTANIMDIAPTAYYCLGMEIPGNLDGKLLTEMLDPARLQSAPPAYGPDLPISGQEGDYSDSEKQAIEERLKNLGYM